MQRWVHNPDERDDIREEIREFNDANPDGQDNFQLVDEVEEGSQDEEERAGEGAGGYVMASTSASTP